MARAEMMRHIENNIKHPILTAQYHAVRERLGLPGPLDGVLKGGDTALYDLCTASLPRGHEDFLHLASDVLQITPLMLRVAGADDRSVKKATDMLDGYHQVNEYSFLSAHDKKELWGQQTNDHQKGLALSAVWPGGMRDVMLRAMTGLQPIEENGALIGWDKTRQADPEEMLKMVLGDTAVLERFGQKEQVRRWFFHKGISFLDSGLVLGAAALASADGGCLAAPIVVGGIPAAWYINRRISHALGGERDVLVSSHNGEQVVYQKKIEVKPGETHEGKKTAHGKWRQKVYVGRETGKIYEDDEIGTSKKQTYRREKIDFLNASTRDRFMNQAPLWYQAWAQRHIRDIAEGQDNRDMRIWGEMARAFYRASEQPGEYGYNEADSSPADIAKRNKVKNEFAITDDASSVIAHPILDMKPSDMPEGVMHQIAGVGGASLPTNEIMLRVSAYEVLRARERHQDRDPVIVPLIHPKDIKKLSDKIAPEFLRAAKMVGVHPGDEAARLNFLIPMFSRIANTNPDEEGATESKGAYDAQRFAVKEKAFDGNPGGTGVAEIILEQTLPRRVKKATDVNKIRLGKEVINRKKRSAKKDLLGYDSLNMIQRNPIYNEYMMLAALAGAQYRENGDTQSTEGEWSRQMYETIDRLRKNAAYDIVAKELLSRTFASLRSAEKLYETMMKDDISNPFISRAYDNVRRVLYGTTDDETDETALRGNLLYATVEHSFHPDALHRILLDAPVADGVDTSAHKRAGGNDTDVPKIQYHHEQLTSLMWEVIRENPEKALRRINKLVRIDNILDHSGLWGEPGIVGVGKYTQDLLYTFYGWKKLMQPKYGVYASEGEIEGMKKSMDVLVNKICDDIVITQLFGSDVVVESHRPSHERDQRKTIDMNSIYIKTAADLLEDEGICSQNPDEMTLHSTYMKKFDEMRDLAYVYGGQRREERKKTNMGYAMDKFFECGYVLATRMQKCKDQETKEKGADLLKQLKEIDASSFETEKEMMHVGHLNLVVEEK